MHDIDRDGNATAVRLAALAALHKAQTDGGVHDVGEAPEAATQGDPDGRARSHRPPEGDAEATDTGAAHNHMPGGSAGVFAAVEAAVRKGRRDFVCRLMEYRQKLDCDAIRQPGADLPDRSIEEAQFIAHRIAGVGKTLGFADLGDAARQTEAAIAAYKLERSPDLRRISISRICDLARLIEGICVDQDNCPA